MMTGFGYGICSTLLGTLFTLPVIPWKSILGMRNRLVHAYFDIDLDVLWYTTTVSIPPLIQILEGIITPGSHE